MSDVSKFFSISKAKIFCLLAILSIVLCSSVVLAGPSGRPSSNIIPPEDVFDLPTTNYSLDFVEQVYLSGTSEVTVTVVTNLNLLEGMITPSWLVVKLEENKTLENVVPLSDNEVIQFTISEPGNYNVNFHGYLSGVMHTDCVFHRDLILCAVEADDGSLIVYPISQGASLFPNEIISYTIASEPELLANTVTQLRMNYTALELLGQVQSKEVFVDLFGQPTYDSYINGSLTDDSADALLSSLPYDKFPVLIGSFSQSFLFPNFNLSAIYPYLNFDLFIEQEAYLPIAAVEYSSLFLNGSSGFDFNSYGEIVGQNYSYFFSNGVLQGLYLQELQYSESGQPILIAVEEGTKNLNPSNEEFQMYIITLGDLVSIDPKKFGRVTVPQGSTATMSSLSFPNESFETLNGETFFVTKRCDTEFLSNPAVSNINSDNSSILLFVDVSFAEKSTHSNLNEIFKENPVVVSFKVPKVENGLLVNQDELKIYHFKDDGTSSELEIESIEDFDDDFYSVVVKTPGFSGFAVVSTASELITEQAPPSNPAPSNPAPSNPVPSNPAPSGLTPQKGSSGSGSATVSRTQNNFSNEITKSNSSLPGSLPLPPLITETLPDLLENSKGHFTLFSTTVVLLSSIGIWYYIRRQI